MKKKAVAFEKPYTKSDLRLVELAERALEELSKRHGNEEVAGMFSFMAYALKNGLRKGIIGDTLAYYEAYK